MRKVLVFLALFGIGLAALLLLRQRTPRPHPAPIEQGTPTEPGQFTEVPLDAKEPGKDTGALQIQVRGELDVTQFGGEGAIRKPIRKLHARDSEALGGDVYLLQDMKLTIFDPSGEKTTAEIVSPRTRLKIDFSGGKPSFGESDEALLSDVEATLFERAPVVPLLFKIRLLQWQVGANRLLSDEPVTITGPGLQASGDGLNADIATGHFVLPTAGSIELDLPRGVRAKLEATGAGPIEVSKTAIEGVDHVELVASEGARLSATGAESFRLDADEIRMLARQGDGAGKDFALVRTTAKGSVVAVSRGDTFRADEAEFRVTPEGRLEHGDLKGAVALESTEGSVHGDHATFDFSETGLPSRAHVDGSVVLRHGEDEFRSRAADFEFGPDGRISKATLVGDPDGSVAIGRFVPPDQPELQAAHAQLAGPGPLVLLFSDVTKVELAGPGTLKVPEADLEVRAERSLSGEAGADHKTGTLTADGAVTIDWAGDDLKSESVTLSTSVDEQGQTIVDATSVGPTTIHRTLPDGAHVTLAASDGLSARSVGRKVFVPVARGVDLAVEGARAFRARAATVTDLDWEARAFVAEGDVSFESDRGSGSADRVVASSTEDVELTGSEGKPAHFARTVGTGEQRTEEARIEGLTIHARTDALDAAGDVRADFTAADASYHLEGGTVRVEFDPASTPGPGEPRPFRASASTKLDAPLPGVRAWIQTLRGESTLSCRELHVAGTTKPRRSEAPGVPPVSGVTTSDVRAEGDVVVDWSAQGGIEGTGDLLVIDPGGRGRLSAEPGKRVHASGRLTPISPPYDLDADWVEFDEAHLEAHAVDLRLQAGAAKIPGETQPILTHLTAGHLRAEPNEMLLEGEAHIDGLTQQLEPWSIDAGSIRIVGKFTEKNGFSPADFEIVQAWDGFDARLGIRGRAKGTRLEGKQGTIRLEGSPTAELLLGPIVMRSAWIEYGTENMLLSTDKGTIGPAEGGPDAWTITYEALKPFDREDKTILALRNPVFLDGDVEVRALWMLLWVDREEWRRSGRKVVTETATTPDLRVKVPEEGAAQTPPVPPKRKPHTPGGRLGKMGAAMQKLRADPISRILSEAYIQGNVEMTEAGDRRALASAIYLDVLEGHGWVRDADFLDEVGVRGRDQQLRIRAEWLRVSSDFSLRADKATLSFCSYDEPHYVVETGDLRLKPNAGGKIPWDISATRNALRFENGWAIPLPPVVYTEDEEGNPIVENLNLGQSAKFGASIGATFNVGLGKFGNGLGKAFGHLLALPKNSVKGHWSFHADFLGSRGFLFGTGLELRSTDRFRLEAEFSAIPDGNEDKGLIRVDQDERSTLRDWFRARGRYKVSNREWYDIASSIQSDPGVQSEFFESQYYRYEQKDNFLHWRKADDAWLYSASAKVLLEDRTDIEELPKAGVFRGRAPVGSLGDLEILYTGSLDAGYFKRHEGDTSFLEPSDPVPPPGVGQRPPPGYGQYADGFGEREVARVDTEQRFETPFALGFAGLRATPWVSGRATFWDQGQDPDTSPSRVSAIAGFDLSTTFWRRYERDVFHSIVPFVSVHGDLVTEESDGEPVRFDTTEDSVEGRFVDVGLRSRVWNPVSKARFDVEARATYAADLPDGRPDGIQPIGVLGEMLTWMGEMPVGISHDGRYDVEDGITRYSRSFLGFRPHPKWDLEFGYHRGFGDEVVLVDPNVPGTIPPIDYEAVSAGTRYRATDKWEVELAETISLHDDRGLDNVFLLRRIGHDFVTQVEVGYIAGEGSRFSINLTPILTWKPGGIGLLDRWLGR